MAEYNKAQLTEMIVGKLLRNPIWQRGKKKQNLRFLLI